MKGQRDLKAPLPHLNLIKVNFTLSLAGDSLHAALMSHSSWLSFMNARVEWSQVSDLPANYVFVKTPTKLFAWPGVKSGSSPLIMLSHCFPLQNSFYQWFLSAQVGIVPYRDTLLMIIFCPNSSISTLYQEQHVAKCRIKTCWTTVHSVTERKNAMRCKWCSSRSQEKVMGEYIKLIKLGTQLV